LPLQWPALLVRQFCATQLKAGEDLVANPSKLLVENTDYYKTFKLDYHGGERYPHLVRDEAKPDLLTDIYRAK
jgi:hypothetical protein